MRACRHLRSDRLLLFELHAFFLNPSTASRSILPATYTYVPTTLRQCFQRTQQSRSKGTGFLFSRTPHVRPAPSVRSNGKYTDRWILILIYTPSIGSYSLVLFSCTLSHSKVFPNLLLPSLIYTLSVSSMQSHLQLIPHSSLFSPSTTTTTTDIRHGHNLDHQTRPTGKMLCTLSLSRLGVILFPRESRFLPRIVHGIDQILP